MSFYKRYELDRLIADGDAKTFRATDNTTGRIVLLHMFNPSGQPVLAALKNKLGSNPQHPMPPLVELGEFAGSPYAVTEEIPGFRNIREWVATLPVNGPAGGAMPVAAAPKPAPAPVAKDVPADQAPTKRPVIDNPPSQLRVPSHPGSMTAKFNSLFPDERPLTSPARPQSAAPPPPSAPAPAPAPPLASEPERGEFTRMFGAPSAKPASPSAPSSSQGEPGEFTRMFNAPPAPKPVAPPASPPVTAAGPGEFTQIFRLPLESTGTQRPPRKQADAADDFEKMFGPTPKGAPPPMESEDPGLLTNMFNMGKAGEAINIEEEQARAARSRAPEAKPFQAPSEFTRRFGPADGARAIPPTIRMQPGQPQRAASQFFGTPEQLARPAQGSSLPNAPSGPSEFTRLMATPQNRPAAPPPVPVAPVNTSKKTWVLWLLIGVPVLALIAIAVIVLMRNR